MDFIKDNLGWIILLIIVLWVCWNVIKELLHSSMQTLEKDNTQKNNHNEKIIMNEETGIKHIEHDTVIKEEPIIVEPTKTKENPLEIKRKLFVKNKEYLEVHSPEDNRYIIVLFETGLLYEELYKDYFRAAAHVYLATLFDNQNKEYEENYLRLCKLVRKNNGADWEYYITLIHEINDIDKYVEELLNQRKLKTEPKQTIKKVVKKNSSLKPTKSIQVHENKFEDFNTESYLHSLGYKVGVTGLSEYQRRKLLKKVLDNGSISKYDVIETLERNISMFRHRTNRQKAVADWRSDLRYIRDNF